jgi:small subunit ribosomal protein S2
MSQIPSLPDLLKAGVHFGHKTSKRNPKMKPYIFCSKNEISIIDLQKTSQQLEHALAFVKNIARQGGTIIFVGTKRQAQEVIKNHALNCGMPYVHTRWIGGTITNYAIISKMIKNYLKMKEKTEAGEYKKYTKKEQLDLSRKIEELEGLIGGIHTLTKLPDALYIVDPRKEETPFKEALKRHIPVIALCDTNTNPENITYPIPANDDAIKSIEIITAAIADAVCEGKSERAKDLANAQNIKITGTTDATTEKLVDVVPEEKEEKSEEDEIEELPANLRPESEDE